MDKKSILFDRFQSGELHSHEGFEYRGADLEIELEKLRKLSEKCPREFSTAINNVANKFSRLGAYRSHNGIILEILGEVVQDYLNQTD